MQKVQNYIGGRFHDPLHQDWLVNTSPINESVIAEVANSTAADVDLAVQAAKAAFSSWSRTTAFERSEILLELAARIEDRFDDFAQLETLDNGKPLWLSQKLDIPRAIENLTFFANYVCTLEDQHLPKNEHVTNVITRAPVGVAALITPWNLPLYLLTWKIAPALACGNTVVCKPSEVTPMTAHLLAEVMDDSSLPAGVCNFVFGNGVDAGKPLVAHQDVALVSFTGGTQTGQQIQRDIAGQCKKGSFELGGKNPIIVDCDVNIDSTVDWLIKASFLNQGQICLCAERIFVHQDIYAELLEAFALRTKTLKVGDPFNDGDYMGPLVSRQHWDKVKACIETRVAGGAKIVAGDEPLAENAGYYMRPTILTGLPPDHIGHAEEIFGPVVAVEPFADIDKVLAQINQSRFGLCASIFCRDQDRAKAWARQIQTGTVWINCWLERDLRVPFGGVKQSGLGREGGAYSVDFFTEYKTICTDKR